MLKRFVFRNCYSFKDETVFSMEAVNAMKDNASFVVRRGREGSYDYVLPVAAIYGVNAGGKSNLIRALTDAAFNIRVSGVQSQLRNRPFYITGKPASSFEHRLNLLIGDYEYEYGYEADNNEIIMEFLKKRKIGSQGDFEDVFVRTGSKVNTNHSLNDTDKTLINSSAPNKKSLIVSLVGPIGVDGCTDIFNWCESILSVTRIKGEDERHEHLNNFAASISNDSKATSRLSEFICKFDPAIGFAKTVMRDGESSDNAAQQKHYRLSLCHTVNETDSTIKSIGFPVQWESNGTQKILELYATLMDALDNGKPLVYDELDTMLHPLVFKKIVALFNDKNENKHHAQLIFAAHNTVVMNREDLRRDEIHIVTKSDGGVSSTYRVSDITDENGKKIRMDASYDRLYLEGLLGPTPDSFFDFTV